MVNIFYLIKDKFRVSHTSKVGSVKQMSLTDSDNIPTYEELLSIYEEYKDKSLREGIYYLKGSEFMRELIEEYRDVPNAYQFFMNHFNLLDQKEPQIPLEVGLFVEGLIREPDTRLGMHRSNAILEDDLYTSATLHSIMRDGLINNGMAMQGLVTEWVSPSQTVSPANDPIYAIRTLKSSYRNSKGAVLVKFPKKYVDSQYEIPNKADAAFIYNVDEKGVRYIKPEYIIGYIRCSNGSYEYFSREDLLENYKEKEL